MPRRRNPELNAGDSGVELGPEEFGPPPSPPTLWVKQGYAIRHRVGGGRIPVLFAAVSSLESDALSRIDERQKGIESGREYAFEALTDLLNWGLAERHDPRAHFWIGHGAGAWAAKDVLAEVRRAGW